MTDRLAIHQWAEEDRPREKMRDQGSDALSKAELLAILIGSGTPKKSAVELMQDVMHDCNDNLNTLGKMSIRDLCKYDGIGEAKAITILAACELGKRRQNDTPEKRPKFTNSEDIYNYMHPIMQDLYTEEGWVLYLNNASKLIKKERISRGGISETAIDVRIIIKEALFNNATQIILCHNHPSGSVVPSRDDDVLTAKTKEACKLMRIHLADHVIVADGDYYSYYDNGKL